MADSYPILIRIAPTSRFAGSFAIGLFDKERELDNFETPHKSMDST